jgi:hypothetical protein
MDPWLAEMAEISPSAAQSPSDADCTALKPGAGHGNGSIFMALMAFMKDLGDPDQLNWI